MARKFFLGAFLFGSILIGGQGCELIDGKGDVDGGSTPGADAGPPPEGLVTTKNANEVAEADFSEGTEQYLVVPYSVSSVAADEIAFTINLTTDGASSTTSGLKMRWPQKAAHKYDPAFVAKWQSRLAVAKWKRRLAVEAAAKIKKRGVKPQQMTSCQLSSDCEATEVCHLGECASTVSLDVSAFSATATISAQVKAKGTHAALLVDDASTLSDADATAILQSFDTVIYPRDVALFGNPPLQTGTAQLASDRNGDGLVWLVLTDKVAEKNSVGFFLGTDFTDEEKSNKADLLYIKPSTGAAGLAAVDRTMAHEFQHLLGFATKVYKAKVSGGSGSLEALWLDEGLSHFAEDACGYGAENVTLLDQELFPSFGDAALFEAAEDTTAMRAMALTFVQYLFERKGGVSYGADGSVSDLGGATWLKALHSQAQSGAASITATYGDAKNAVGQWIVALALAGRGVTDYPAYNFANPISDPKTGATIGMVIRGNRVDATGETVALTGPNEDEISDDETEESMRNASAKFFTLEGKSGKVSVNVSSTDSDFRFALIKLK
jgi:hypothetical protein